MSLRFVLGRAGAGKTHHCLTAIAEELARAPQGPPLILLVPEQATFQMEQALLAAVRQRTGRLGFARARVMSFRRLAWWVFQETGSGAPAVSELGQQLILRALLAREAPSLRLFGQVADRPGFIQRLAAMMEELAAYGHDAAALRAQRERLAQSGQEESLLAAKLHDLERVVTAYAEYLGRRQLADPSQALDRLADRLPACSWLRGARLWVDGFTGFTPQELHVLETLLPRVAAAEITLCLDPDEVADGLTGTGRDPAAGRGRAGEGAPGLDPSALFHPTAVTERQLRERARRAGVRLQAPLRLPAGGPPTPPPPRFRNPVLAHLERELFRFPGRRYRGPAEGITLVAAPNPREEVAAAAREILRLVRDHGYRFRDVTVIVRDLEAYHDLLTAVFDQHGIPLFVDRRRPVGHHPLVELVRSAVETVASDWAYEPVFRYLKTDLVPIPRGAVDRLENYVLAFGIRGRLWYDERPWRWWHRFSLEEDEEPAAAQAEELQALDGLRRQAVAALLAFHRRVAAARRRPQPASQLAAALWQLLEDLDVPTRIRQWSQEAEAAGQLDRAQEHLQVWNGIVELLEQTAESLPDVALTLGEFARVLEAGLESLRVGLIPPGLDQVVAGTVERSRHPNVRVALVLGATDGAFPRRGEEEPLFSDAEREELAAGGMELGPTGQVRTFHEQFLTYVALTRARERLWISYPLADGEGRALAPSWITRRLRALIPGLVPVTIQPQGVDEPATPDQAVDLMVRRLQRDRAAGAPAPASLCLYQWAVTEPAVRPRSLRVLRSLAHHNRVQLADRGLARLLFAREQDREWVLHTSVTRLERFTGCPFRHFAAHGLRLRERPVQRLDAPQLGRLYHAALSLLTRRLEERGLDWAQVEPAELDGLLDQVLAQVGSRLEQELAVGTGYQRHLLGRARRTLRETVERLAEHARRGDFRPLAVEVEFGTRSSPLPAPQWTLPGGERMTLRGRIDRVDGAPAPDGRWWVRVVDYKSSSRDLSLDEAYHGLALQLAVYLMVVARAGGALLPGTRGATGRREARRGEVAASGPEEPARAGAAGLAQVRGAEGPSANPLPRLEPAALLFLPVDDPYLDVARPVGPEEARQGRARLLRARGWVLDEEGVLLAHDRDGHTDAVIPVTLRQDGRPRKGSRVMTRHQLAALFRHVERRLVEAGEGVLAGRVEVAPYRLRDRSPCRICAYRPVCQFDPRVPGNDYRRLPPLGAGAVWERLEGQAPERQTADEAGSSPAPGR